MNIFIYTGLKTVALSMNEEEKYKILKVVLSLAMVKLCALLAGSIAVRIAGEFLAAWTDISVHIGNTVFGLPICSVNCSVCR
jgi:hypothetical protein